MVVPSWRIFMSDRARLGSPPFLLTVGLVLLAGWVGYGAAGSSVQDPSLDPAESSRSAVLRLLGLDEAYLAELGESAAQSTTAQELVRAAFARLAVGRFEEAQQLARQGAQRGEPRAFLLSLALSEKLARSEISARDEDAASDSGRWFHACLENSLSSRDQVPSEAGLFFERWGRNPSVKSQVELIRWGQRNAGAEFWELSYLSRVTVFGPWPPIWHHGLDDPLADQSREIELVREAWLQSINENRSTLLRYLQGQLRPEGALLLHFVRDIDQLETLLLEAELLTESLRDFPLVNLWVLYRPPGASFSVEERFADVNESHVVAVTQSDEPFLRPGFERGGARVLVSGGGQLLRVVPIALPLPCFRERISDDLSPR